MDPIIEQLRGKVIASCQAYMGEPLRHPETMAQMARACELGGAGGIRCQGLSDIAAIKGRTEVPVIGIWKEGHEGVYITPTLRHARACVMAGADIVAIDATDRSRPDGKTLEDTVRPLKEEGVLVMADCSTIEDIRHAFAIGCDIASTTLSHPGAAIDCGMADGPDVALVRQAVEEFPDKPVICEGRVHTPADAKAAMDAGAWAVVVGTAITHPTSITSWFVEAAGKKVLAVPSEAPAFVGRGFFLSRSMSPCSVSQSLRQSSLGGTVHWTVPVAAELAL